MTNIGGINKVITLTLQILLYKFETLITKDYGFITDFKSLFYCELNVFLW